MLMANNTKISVIIPFYNARPLIDGCVASLMRQTTAEKTEYIFIDDGSTDGSADIVKKAIQANTSPARSIRLLSLPHNQGLAAARQTGLNNATGEYISYCDADDFVDAPMYASMLKAAVENNADVVCTPLLIETGRKTKIERFKKPMLPDLNDMPLDTLHFSLCNKLVRRSMLTEHGLEVFPGVNCWEDMSIMFRVYIFARKTIILDTPFYHYRRSHSTSLTAGKAQRILDEHLLFVSHMEEWFDSQPPQLRIRYAPFIRFARFTAKIKMLRCRNRNIRLWKTTFPDANAGILAYRNIPWHYRILFYLADRLPLEVTAPLCELANCIQQRKKD